MIGSTNLDASRDLEAQSPEVISRPPGAPYLHPSSHTLLTTTKGDVGGSGLCGTNTGQSGVEGPPMSALPSAADSEIDLEAQPGITPVLGKSSHHCLRPSFHWALADRLTFLQMLGEGSEGQLMATHVSGDDVREDAPLHESIPASSQIELETPSQAHGQADVDQGVYILSTTGSLDNLMQLKAHQLIIPLLIVGKPAVTLTKSLQKFE
jgi:hypothetical protein